MLRSISARSITPYCQTWNLQLAEEMQTHFPIELRDLVYGYLWDARTIDDFPDLWRVAGGRCVNNGHSALRLPHFISPDFMGLVTAREIVRALYSAFHSSAPGIVIRPKHIKSAVTQDVFGVGLDPSMHLKSLTLELDLDHLRTSRTHHKLSSTCRHSDSEKAYTKRTNLKEWLKALLYVKYKSSFVLFVDLYQRNVRIAVLEEVLDDLGEVRRALKARNMYFFVNWTYRGRWLGSRWEDSMEQDLDDFYVLPRRIWKQNMLEILTSV